MCCTHCAWTDVLQFWQVRALLEQPAIAEVVQYKKRKDHFMFTIESTGILQPDLLLVKALDVLHDKAHRLLLSST